MTDTNAELTFTQIVDALPEDAYYAFATAQDWRDWLCVPQLAKDSMIEGS